jgi:ATP-dependent RNA helicase MSS116
MILSQSGRSLCRPLQSSSPYSRIFAAQLMAKIDTTTRSKHHFTGQLILDSKNHSWCKQDGIFISKNYLSTSAAATPTEADEQEELPLFTSLETIHPASVHAITHKLKLERMTEIQYKTFDAASTGSDVLARARTGTGKTLAFLVPGIQSALRSGRVPGRHGYSVVNDGGTQQRGGIAMLILSPTRELAVQIHNQAQVLTSSHTNSGDYINDSNQHPMVCQVMYGGSSRNNDLKKLQSNTPFILVATPGRLIDHMQNSHVNGVPFSEMIGNVSVLVLDEADRCLDMGFRTDMEWILDVMGRYRKKQEEMQQALMEQRQTLLFSATFGKDLRSIMDKCMRHNYVTVDCVHDVDPTTHTNQSVSQTFVTLPPPRRRVDISTMNAANSAGVSTSSYDDVNQYRWISGLVDIITDIVYVRNPDEFKVVVFFPTTAMCQFFSHIFTNVYKIPVIELHSKKSQSNRTFTSKLFRQVDKGVLFTTDVSARGVDYPNVSHVIQFGSAESRETYIHRLGRTGRAGRKGKGIIIVGGKGEERAFIGRELQGLEVKRDEIFQSLVLGNVVAKEGDEGGGVNGAKRRNDINAARLQKIRSSIRDNTNPDLRNMASQTYRSLLGYYVSRMKTIGANYKADVVEYVNGLAIQMGFDDGEMPSITQKVVNNIGLQGIRGLNVAADKNGGPWRKESRRTSNEHGKKVGKKGGKFQRERRG